MIKIITIFLKDLFQVNAALSSKLIKLSSCYLFLNICKYRDKLVHRVVENNNNLPHGVPIYFYIYKCFFRNTDAAHTSFH